MRYSRLQCIVVVFGKCMCLAVWMAHSLVCFGFDITFHSNLFSLQCSVAFVIVWLICSCKFVSTLCVLFGGSVSDLRLWCPCSPFSLCLSGFGKVVIVRPGNFVLPWASPVVHRRVHPVCLRFTQRGLFEIRAPLGWTGFTSCHFDVMGVWMISYGLWVVLVGSSLSPGGFFWVLI